MDRVPDKENVKRVYEAAAEGSVEALNELIEKDRFILKTVSLTSFSETPLHISALLGHLEFSTLLVHQNPNMVSELDSLRCSPLHLASAEGHTHIVKVLLKANAELCLVPDQDGRIPLHLAAMRGRVEVVRELIDAKPDSASMLLDGDTVLHVCIEYNQLDALKLLVSVFKENDANLLIKRNKNGDTILHLAAKLNQFETVKYLLLVPEVKASINTLDAAGLTARDVIETCTRSFRSFKILEILTEKGAVTAAATGTKQNITNSGGSEPTESNQDDGENKPTKKRSIREWLIGFINREEHKKGEGHDALMIVATVIATMTFQVATNPPGGVWDKSTREQQGYHCEKAHGCLAGTAIQAYQNEPDEYTALMTYDIIAFIASLSVILFLISGMPVYNKVATGILRLTMCVSIMFLALTYLASVDVVTPSEDSDIYSIPETVYNSTYIWISLVGLVAVFHMVKILFRASHKLHGSFVKEEEKSKARQEKSFSEQDRSIGDSGSVLV